MNIFSFFYTIFHNFQAFFLHKYKFVEKKYESLIKLKCIWVLFDVNFPSSKINKSRDPRISRDSGQFFLVIPGYGKPSNILNPTCKIRRFHCLLQIFRYREIINKTIVAMEQFLTTKILIWFFSVSELLKLSHLAYLNI